MVKEEKEKKGKIIMAAPVCEIKTLFLFVPLA